MAEECGPWPPSLQEFVALVKTKQTQPEHVRALPVPRRSPDEIRAGAAHMQRIKAMLAGATKKMP